MCKYIYHNLNVPNVKKLNNQQISTFPEEGNLATLANVLSAETKCRDYLSYSETPMF